jgi:hypothetical protein
MPGELLSQSERYATKPDQVEEFNPTFNLQLPIASDASRLTLFSE